MTGPERDAQVALLLAEVRELRAELAGVRGELEALDAGVIEAGTTASRAQERADALGRAVAGAFEIAGHPLQAEVTRLTARVNDYDKAWAAMQTLPSRPARRVRHLRSLPDSAS